LTRTEHAAGFVLKGGILPAAYGVRRPTKDTDANAASADLTAEHVADVVRDLAAVQVADGVVFDVETITVQEIREQSAYPGLRVRVKATIGSWRSTAIWDVSAGDPIIPPPRMVTIERVFGEPIVLLGYAPETAIPRKGSRSSNAGSPAPGARLCRHRAWLNKASTQTRCFAQHARLPGTVACPWSRSHHTSPGTAKSGRPDRQPGAARKSPKPCQKRI